MDLRRIDMSALVWFSSAFMSLLLLINNTDAQCKLPSDISGADWQDVKTGLTLTFSTSTMTGWRINAQGDILSQYTCISNTGLVYVFKSDKAYSDEGQNRWLYFCMKLTKLSRNLYYFYLLSDKDKSISPATRVYNPLSNAIPPNNQPTCRFCNFTSTIPQNDYHEIKRLGTDELARTNPKLCLPCESTCEADVCNPNPCANGGKCNVTGDSYTCTCKPEWTSTNCTVPDNTQPRPSSRLTLWIVVAIVIIVVIVIVSCLVFRTITARRRKAEFLRSAESNAEIV